MVLPNTCKDATVIFKSCCKCSACVGVLGFATSALNSAIELYTFPVILFLIISSDLAGNTGTSTGALLSSTGAGTVAVATKSVSIYNAGAAAGTVNVNGGGNVSIPAGVTVNFDAGTASKYPASHFAYNAAGTTFIISYTY